MSNKHETLKVLFDDIADAIREKNESTDPIVADNFPDEIRAIESGMSASIFVTGLSESDAVTATKDGKTINGKWVTKEVEVATQVPVMTSNTAPSGVASAKSVLTTYYAYQAFDGNSVSYTTSVHGDARDWWVAYNFGFPVTVDSFDFAPVGPGSTGYWNRFPATVSLQGSNDGDVWNTIQDFETNNPGGTTEPPQTKTFTVSNPQTYSQYRLFWKTLTSDNDGYAGCSTIQFYGTTLGTVSGHEITGIGDKGMWTVTATNGEETVTQDVLVDGAFDYEIEMFYKLWLYREGDECEEVTGGWVGAEGGYVYSGTAGDEIRGGVKNADNLYFPPSVQGRPALGTNIKVNLSPYNKLCFVRLAETTNLVHPWVSVLTDGKDIANANRLLLSTSGTMQNVKENGYIDVTEVTGEHYICVACTSSNGSGYIYSMWLE